MNQNYKSLISGIKAFFKKNNHQKAVLGLSGGIDSAVCLKILADALGNKNITALIMPEKGVTLKENVKDAVELCNDLKIKHFIIEINRFLKPFNFPWQNKIAKINTKARIRANILYNFANSNNCLVIGTSNKTELALGYFTKYGDGAADLEIIGALYKTEVIELAKHLKIPEKIINKKPSAELFKCQTDEKELGMSYKDIDKALKSKKIPKKIKNMINKNKHKSTTPYIINKSL